MLQRTELDVAIREMTIKLKKMPVKYFILLMQNNFNLAPIMKETMKYIRDLEKIISSCDKWGNTQNASVYQLQDLNKIKENANTFKVLSEKQIKDSYEFNKQKDIIKSMSVKNKTFSY